jgi:hypothetical protein
MNINQFMELNGFAPGSISIDKKSVEVHAGGLGSGCNPSVGTCGRPATGEQYHGTSITAVKSILKTGIKPTDTTLGYKAAFATNSFDLAFSYGVGAAAKAGKTKGAVIAIAVIKDPKSAGMTMMEGKNNVAISQGGIKPQFIDRIEIYNWNARKGDKPIKVMRAQANELSNKAYVVLLFSPTNTIHAGGPGSGRHKTGRKQKDAGRQARGLASYNPSTQAKQQQAINNEKSLAKAIP